MWISRLTPALAALLLTSVTGCKKKSADNEEPPPEPTDWKAEIADLVEHDFSDLCRLRYEAEAEKATQAVADIDAIGRTWKAASRDEMRAATKTAHTDPTLVKYLEAFYAAPGDVCDDRTLSVNVRRTQDKAMDQAIGSFLYSRTIDETARKTGVFAPQGFAALLRRITGPWVEVKPATGDNTGQIFLIVDFHGAGTVTFSAQSLPLLAATSKVALYTFERGKLGRTDELPLGDVQAQGEGTISYTTRTNRQTGMTSYADAPRQATIHMMEDVAAQTARLLASGLGLGGADDAWAPIAGTWRQEPGDDPESSCAERRDDLSGQDFGDDPAPWKAWLRDQR